MRPRSESSWARDMAGAFRGTRLQLERKSSAWTGTEGARGRSTVSVAMRRSQRLKATRWRPPIGVLLPGRFVARRRVRPQSPEAGHASRLHLDARRPHLSLLPNGTKRDSGAE